MNAKTALLICALAASPAAALAAQAPPPPANARVAAPIDLTGQWVAVVTEDWRWRMVTPPKGDYASLPLNAAGRAAADAWNLAADNAAGPAGQCKAYGVGGITRIPGRMRISWADDSTLKVDYDAGQQTRMLHFIGPARGGVLPALTELTAPKGARTLQGETRAQWFKQPQSTNLGFAVTLGTGGSLRTFTLNSSGGYLRKNGVPYSPDATFTENWSRFTGLEGDEWLVITTITYDPKYLTVPFLTSTNFRKETDPSKWNPQPCRTSEPLGRLGISDLGAPGRPPPPPPGGGGAGAAAPAPRPAPASR